MENRCLVRERYGRLAAYGQDAMFALPSEPMAVPKCGLTQVKTVRS